VPRDVEGRGRQLARRRQDLPLARSGKSAGRAVLVGHALRQSDMRTDRDRSGRGRPVFAPATRHESGWIGRPLLRSVKAGRSPELDRDDSRQGLVHVLPPLRAQGGILRQELAARGHRTGEVGESRDGGGDRERAAPTARLARPLGRGKPAAMKRRRVVGMRALRLLWAAFALLAAGCGDSNDLSRRTTTPIEHVIVVIGENRSFDALFATYVPPDGQRIWNLRSLGIVDASGNPGPSFARAAQQSATSFTRYELSPTRAGSYATLPQPNTTLAGRPERADVR